MEIGLKNIFLVFIGGGLGCILRYLVSLFCSSPSSNVPYHTLLVNIIGSFIIGLLFAVLVAKTAITQELRLFLMVGFCGGLTTFSTFSLELFSLFGQSKLLFFSYALLSVVSCFIAVFIGVLIGGVITKNGF